ncbi:MAG: hypothetical protein PHR82_08225 [Endomicrobiaceae bacterium]|nr:hypothetical protein [Endomicrobiaceae bacterium]
MATPSFEKWAEQIPVSDRRKFISDESKKVFELSDKLQMFGIMVVWIAGLNKPEIFKSVALFDNILDAQNQEKIWDKQYDKYVHEIYKFW